MFKACNYELGIHAIESRGDVFWGDRVENMPLENKGDRVCSDLIDYIEAHLTVDFSLSDLARGAGLSQDIFTSHNGPRICIVDQNPKICVNRLHNATKWRIMMILLIGDVPWPQA